MSKTFVGIDVSQSHLDVHVRPANLDRRFDNTKEGVAELVAFVDDGFGVSSASFEGAGEYILSKLLEVQGYCGCDLRQVSNPQ